MSRKNKNYWADKGDLQKDLKQYKLMCKKVTEITPINSMYFTYDELVKHSGLSPENFHKRCFSWYLSLEEDEWDPCIELCGLCALMSDKYNKIWYIKEKDWKIKIAGVM